MQINEPLQEAATAAAGISAGSKPKRRFKAAMATGNVVVVTMSTLDKETTMMTGDAVFCHGCQGTLSTMSTVADAANGKLSWTWYVFDINLAFTETLTVGDLGRVAANTSPRQQVPFLLF